MHASFIHNFPSMVRPGNYAQPSNKVTTQENFTPHSYSHNKKMTIKKVDYVCVFELMCQCVQCVYMCVHVCGACGVCGVCGVYVCVRRGVVRTAAHPITGMVILLTKSITTMS